MKEVAGTELEGEIDDTGFFEGGGKIGFGGEDDLGVVFGEEGVGGDVKLVVDTEHAARPVTSQARRRFDRASSARLGGFRRTLLKRT